jgi:hypothetical protein
MERAEGENQSPLWLGEGGEIKKIMNILRGLIKLNYTS